jgi:hypothetical protein
MKDWTEFGLRALPSMSARTRPGAYPPFLQSVLDTAAVALAKPLVGITTDGKVRRGLFPLRATGVSTRPVLEAAQGFLATLDATQRAKVVLDTEADERRKWFNIHPSFFRHGLMLEDLAPAQRDAVLRLMEATLSTRGFAQARDIMRLNGLLVEITGLTSSRFLGSRPATRPGDGRSTGITSTSTSSCWMTSSCSPRASWARNRAASRAAPWPALRFSKPKRGPA